MHSLSINCSTVATATPPNPTPSSSIPLCPLHTIHTQAFAPPVRLVRLVRQVLQVRQPRPQKNPPTTLISIARAALHATVDFWRRQQQWCLQASRRQRPFFKGVPLKWRGMYPAGRANTNQSPQRYSATVVTIVFGNIQNPSARLLIPVIGSLKEKRLPSPPKKHTN